MLLLHRYASKAAAIAAVALFSACGSGDKGSGLSMDPSSLQFTARDSGDLPASQTIRVTVSASNAAQIAVGYPPGAQQPVWLAMTLDQIDDSHWAWGLAITTTVLPPGTYHAAIRVAIGTEDGELIGYRDGEVTYVVTSNIQATPAELDFQAVAGDPNHPQAKPVELSASTGNWWSASADQSWVELSDSSGTTPATVDVGVNPDGLAAGSYTATVTFTCGDRTDTVIVTLSLAAPAFLAGPASLSFSGINGAPMPYETLAVSMNNRTSAGWNASSSAAWLVLTRSSGTTPDEIAVTVDPSQGPLASGAHSGTITLSSSGYPDVVVPVSLTLTRPTLTATPSSLTLGGSSGSDFSTRTLDVSLNTGTGVYTYSASKSASWMSLSSTTGDVAGGPAALSVTPLPTGLVGGSYSGHVDVTVQVNGDTLSTSVPVQLGVQAHTLEVIDNGVAFTSTPSLSRLTRVLQIEDSLGLTTTPWKAVSNQSWLTVTASGTTSDSLTVTASPSGLTADTVYYATVTLSSTDASVEKTDKVRVGLWVGSAAPAAKTSVATAFTQVVTDPIRPYAYVHDDTGTTISAYNVYTSALVKTFNAPGTLGAMAISHDGSTLFAVDTNHVRVLPVDLDAGTVGSGWSIAGASSQAGLAYVRTKGFGAILAGDGHSYAAETGVQLSPTFYSGASSIAASRGGRLFCANTACYPLDFLAFNPGGLSSGALAYASAGDNFTDVAVSNDGSKVYTASGYPYVFPVTDVASNQQVGTLSGDSYPNNVDVGPDGTVYCGASSLYGPYDVWIYDSTAISGSTSRRLDLTGYAKRILAHQLTVSGDGLRVVALTDDPALVFATSP